MWVILGVQFGKLVLRAKLFGSKKYSDIFGHIRTICGVIKVKSSIPILYRNEIHISQWVYGAFFENDEISIK